MNEIEKLYELVGVEPRCSLWCRTLQIPSTLICEGIPDNKELCHSCLYGSIKNVYYPPFTAEKQIELIKRMFPSYPLNYRINRYQDYTFEEGLAKYINNLWEECLTEEEQAEIRKILE